LGLQIGLEPGRIDILTKISGIAFEEAWPSVSRRISAKEYAADVIGLDALLQNQRASTRPQDLADVAALERLIRAKKR
jgi:hypothetical protein